jgi:hypothetical protein
LRPFAWVVFDGERLSADPRAPGRRLRADPRIVGGEPVSDAYAHVCALPDRDAALRFDEPEVQHVRRDALAWWAPLLGDDLVCMTTFALDASRYGGAMTVARRPDFFSFDPFARLFPGTVVPTELFCQVPAPCGPVIERRVGVPWPGGRFEGL